MKKLLKILTQDSEDFKFYQYIKTNTIIKKNTIFEYSLEFFNELHKDDQTLFIELGLKLGKYKCIETWVENNKELGDIQQIYVRPIIN